MLSIRQGWSLWVLYELVFLIPLALLSATIAPTLLSRAVLFSVGSIVIGYTRRMVAFVRIGEAGVAWWSVRRLGKAEFISLKWKDIDACALKNDGRLHILRIFPRQIANNWPPRTPCSRPSFAERVDRWFRPWPPGLEHIDIDFDLAERPGVEVERACAACAAWIAASGERESSAPIVREFGELTASELRNLAGGRRFVWIALAFLLLLLLIAISTWFAN